MKKSFERLTLAELGHLFDFYLWAYAIKLFYTFVNCKVK